MVPSFMIGATAMKAASIELDHWNIGFADLASRIPTCAAPPDVESEHIYMQE